MTPHPSRQHAHVPADARRIPFARRVGALALTLALLAAPETPRPARWAASTSSRGRTARVLPVYPKDGRSYVVGTPGQEYGIRVCNTTGERVLAVMSVDGVNIVSGETASPSQSGYVLVRLRVRGHQRLAQESRVDRGVLLHRAARRVRDTHRTPRQRRRHRRRVLPRASTRTVWKDSARIAASPRPIRRAAGCRRRDEREPRERARHAQGTGGRDGRATGAGSKIGTGHGRSEDSYVQTTPFVRASATPNETLAIYYDRHENLVALGVLPPPRRAVGQSVSRRGRRFVPDPPTDDDRLAATHTIALPRPARILAGDARARHRRRAARRGPDARLCRGRRGGIRRAVCAAQGRRISLSAAPVRDAGIADELFQDVWMNVIRARAIVRTERQVHDVAVPSRAQPPDRPLARCRACRLAVSAARTRRGDDADDPLAAVPARRTTNPKRAPASASSSRRLKAACAALPAAQREAFLLQQEGGLSLAEIAELTGAGVETVKSRIRYAVAKLRVLTGRFAMTTAGPDDRETLVDPRVDRGMARGIARRAAGAARRLDPRRGASRGRRAPQPSARREATAARRRWWPLAAAATVAAIAVGVLQLTPPEELGRHRREHGRCRRADARGEQDATPRRPRRVAGRDSRGALASGHPAALGARECGGTVGRQREPDAKRSSSRRTGTAPSLCPAPEPFPPRRNASTKAPAQPPNRRRRRRRGRGWPLRLPPPPPAPWPRSERRRRRRP